MVTFLDPEKIISQIDLGNDFHAAEFGSGSGGFVLALADKLRGGLIYACDIQEEPLSALIGRAKTFGFNNIKTIKCDLEEPKGSTLPDDSMDLILIMNTLFQSDEKAKILREAMRVIRGAGQIVIVDWKPDSDFGPEGERVSFEEITKIFIRTGFLLKKELDTGTYHWGGVYAKA